MNYFSFIIANKMYVHSSGITGKLLKTKRRSIYIILKHASNKTQEGSITLKGVLRSNSIVGRKGVRVQSRFRSVDRSLV